MMVGKMTRKMRMDIAAATGKRTTTQPMKIGEAATVPLVTVIMTVLATQGEE
jgi:hypothetical protein